MLEHPNKNKRFKAGSIHNARPSDKSNRYECSDDVKTLAKEMKRLTELFRFNSQDIYNIIHNEFGEGIGKQTVMMFMDDVYGPAFRPRAKTLDKYKYFVWFLRNKEKQFANPKI